MRHLLARIAVGCMVVLFGSVFACSAAYAAGPVDDAIAALHDNPVYVQKGTPGTTADTTAYLQGFLRPGDHIVVVMLDTSSVPIDDAGAAILGSLPEKGTVAISLNGEIKGYSNRIPSVAVNNAMANAKAISMNPHETLATFVRQVHKWQDANPEPEPSPIPAIGNGHGGVFILGGIVAVIVGIGSLLLVGARRAAQSAAEETEKANVSYVLPKKDETDPAVIKQHLGYVAQKYTGVTTMVNESLEQLRLLQQHLGTIREIFQANPGLLAQTDTQFESGKFEVLLVRVIDEACKDLMRVVYQAFARKGDAEAPIQPLVNVIQTVNAKNQTRVDLARELSNQAAVTATEFEGDVYATSATDQVQQLIVRLDQTNRKKVF